MTDIELEEWQKNQFDRCLVENAINKLIETYGILNQTADNRTYNERSQNLEESAILMAISEHGLHQNNALLFLPEPEREGQQSHYYDMCGPSRAAVEPLPYADDRGTSAQPEYSDESSSNNDTTHILEAAVSLAIQKQGLGLSGLNR